MVPSSVEYIPCEAFDLEITRFDPRLVTEECRITTVEQLDEQLCRFDKEPLLAIGLTALDPDEACWRSFCLYLKADRAWIHLIEGPCWTATDPAFEGAADTIVEFLDDAGNLHEVPLRRTISRQQALGALRHWMPDGERLPELNWSRA